LNEFPSGVYCVLTPDAASLYWDSGGNDTAKKEGTMEPESTGGMSEFLAPTPLCDSDNAKVKGKARDLVGDGQDPAVAARSIFHFVRDGINYGLYYPNERASKTLDRGVGYCVTKTNLQMALLRAAGLPCRCHLVQLPKEVARGFIPPFVFNGAPDPFVHPWCECYLEGMWVSCDCVFDEPFYRAMLEGGLMTEAVMPSIDWDGRTDVAFAKQQVKADLGTFSSWDDGLKEALRRGGLPPTSRVLGPVMFWMTNRRISDIRRSGTSKPV
jgi:hypothetical protein